MDCKGFARFGIRCGLSADLQYSQSVQCMLILAMMAEAIAIMVQINN